MKVDLGAEPRAARRLSGIFRDAQIIYPALVILLAVLAVAPLTYPASFQTQTGFNPLYNLMDLDGHLGSSLGWAPTFGRGFDLFRMDGPLPYVAGEGLHLVGLSFVDAIKAAYVLTFLLSGIGMFALGRRLFRSDGAGLLCSVVYVYFPYHLADVYVRGAFGESTLWAVMPFAVLAALQILASVAPKRRVYGAAILAFALGILAQPGLGLLLGLGTLAAVIILTRGRPVSNFKSELAIIIGILLGGALLIPAFLANRQAPQAFTFTPAFVYPFQFLTASWGNDLPKGNYLDQFPFQLGIGAIGLTILALATLFGQKGGESGARLRRPLLFSVIVAAVLLVLMTPPASFLWMLTGATVLLEYPFQLLAFVGLALSLAAGSVVAVDARFSQTPLLAALVVIQILSVYPYLSPEFLDFVPTHQPVARFNGDEIALLDAKIVRPPGILRHGATVELDLQWQALREVNHDYTVFVHVVDETGKTWGGEDTKPQNGALPTLKWTVGRVISDTHTVQIDLAGPPEGYHLELGLYTAPDGERPTTETGATEVRIEENP